MQKLTLLMLIAMMVAGCQTADDRLTNGSTPADVTGPAAGAIAGDMASRLAEQIGSAGSISIAMSKDGTEYATALEAALKGWGYTVITDGLAEKDQKPTEIAYFLYSFDGQILASLSTPSVALGRTYTTTTAGAAPASPISVMQRN
ncbi:conjugal transfer protein TrbH [Rhizobiaceae bacterium n13]|uniref:conjugal transfer protein TrbH n=1 Tax=Ferirhizobium litorale TaxID=2927786 RepID=UPI0024B2D446|nr:conjugal transfer protein TrbH [Fererhizobium litorale]MDI7864965.1 conjugal transfer protein TrbH [Fererhizobium litorale]